MAKNVLHVVCISFSLPYFVGDQLKYFKNKGFNFFLSASPSDHFNSFSKEMGATPIEIKISRNIDPLGDIIALIKLIRQIKKNNIDIVIGHTPKGGLIAMVAAYLTGIKYRYYFRHGLIYQTARGGKRLLLKNIERITGYLSFRVICVSRSILLESNIDKLSPSRKNILLNKGTCNGINCDRFSLNAVQHREIIELKKKLDINKGDFVVGYVGRLVNDKGINELVQAWDIFTNQHKENKKLLLVGPFEDRDAISDHVKLKILNDSSIVHVGLVEDTTVYYALMNVFILPSYREGFPTVVLEASAMQLPIITTTATGCVDSILEDKTGVFVDLNGSSIAAGFDLFYNNINLAKAMGINGRAFVTKNFSEKAVWDEIESKILNN